MPRYGDATYWDERYQQEPTAFDWYQKYEGLEPIIRQHFKPEERILHVGVGTSRLQLDMVQQGGYQQIVNTDISEVCIRHMQELHKSWQQLKYRVGDVRSMPEFKDDSFGGIFDKGTLDAILCGEQASLNSREMLLECHRVLQPGAALLVVTYGGPAARVPLLTQPGLSWCVSMYVVGKCDTELLGPQLSPIIHGPVDVQSVAHEPYHGLNNVHFVYACCKQGGSSTSSSTTIKASSSCGDGSK